jgi:hypothetical protein
VMRDTKVSSEGHWPFLLQFSKKCQLVVFWIWVVLDLDPNNDEIFIEHVKKKGIKIPVGILAKFKRVLSGDVKQKKSTILGHVLGIFEIFRGKRTPDHQSRKIYLIKILPTHQSRQLFLEGVFPGFSLFGRYPVLAKISKSGENVKSAKLSIQIYT